MTDPSAENGRIGEAVVRRFVDRENDALVTVGDFGPLFAAYLDHVRRWESEPDGLSQTLMRQGLGAAVLHLSTRPRDESVGWTINVHQPPTNLFLAGDSGDATVTGRVFTEGVRPADESRMYVQSSRAGRKTTQSTVEIHGVDVLEMFEQYYERSEQLPARFFEVTDEQFLMVLTLPEADGDWVRSLSREEAIGLIDDGLKPLGEVTYRFQCGCSSDRMLDVVRGMFAADPEDLFQGDEGVEIFCPRCGRRWWVERDAFDEPIPAEEDEPSAGEPGSGGEPGGTSA